MMTVNFGTAAVATAVTSLAPSLAIPPASYSRPRLAPVPRGLGLAPREAGHDLAGDGQGVLVVERLVVGDAGDAGVDGGPAQLLGGDILAGGRFPQWRTTQEDGAGAANDDRLVAHGRHVGAARRATPHDQRDLRDARGAHLGLVVEDAPEVVAVGEDLVL